MAATSDMTDELRGVTVPQADEQMLLERHKKEKKELRGVDISLLVVDGLHVNSVMSYIWELHRKPPLLQFTLWELCAGNGPT